MTALIALFAVRARTACHRDGGWAATPLLSPQIGIAAPVASSRAGSIREAVARVARDAA